MECGSIIQTDCAIPQLYFERLRAGSPQAWIVAEKILQPEESLRTGWPIDGTTGYDFLECVQWSSCLWRRAE